MEYGGVWWDFVGWDWFCKQSSKVSVHDKMRSEVLCNFPYLP